MFTSSPSASLLLASSFLIICLPTVDRLLTVRLFATDLPPPVGSEVRLSVALLGGHAFETRAEVTWVREHSAFSSKLPAGAGMRMLDLTDDDKEAIRRFLRQRTPYGYTGA